MSSHAIAALRHAVPYLQLYRDKIFLIKVGGEAFTHPKGADQVLEQVAVLATVGIKTVLVHGGGSQADALANQLGIAYEKVNGRRITSEAMLSVMRLALHGEVQGDLLSAARRLNIHAIGLSGMDAGLIDAEVRQSDVPMGRVGDVKTVNIEVLQTLLKEGYLPIISPMSGDSDGGWLNVNADTAAAEVAVALGAEKVLFMTGAPGILMDREDQHSVVSALTLKELEQLEADGVLGDGMLPKASAIRRCLTGGVPRVHVVSQTQPDTLLIEVFTNEGSGTLVTMV